jgi:hypothetical protein
VQHNERVDLGMVTYMELNNDTFLQILLLEVIVAEHTSARINALRRPYSRKPLCYISKYINTSYTDHDPSSSKQ